MWLLLSGFTWCSQSLACYPVNAASWSSGRQHRSIYVCIHIYYMCGLTHVISSGQEYLSLAQRQKICCKVCFQSVRVCGVVCKVHVHVCVSVHRYIWVCMHVGMEARGLCHVSSSIAFHLFWDGSFHWTWRLSRLAGQGIPRNFLSPENPWLGFQTHAATLLEKYLSLCVRGVLADSDVGLIPECWHLTLICLLWLLPFVLSTFCMKCINLIWVS